jgi:hypothetical protein
VKSAKSVASSLAFPHPIPDGMRLRHRRQAVPQKILFVSIGVHSWLGCPPPPSGHGERSRTIAEIPRPAPCYGNPGSRSVDLSGRASSCSVARPLLLGADQWSMLRGAPAPIRIIRMTAHPPGLYRCA